MRDSRARAFLCAALVAVLLAGAGRSAAEPARSSPPRAVATFAGGCFWCMEPPFDALPGVVSTTSGYSGGTQADPSYEEVSAGTTGHAEAVQIVYDPAQISYERLLEVFWRNVDPVTPNAQFCDRGSQYRSAIFVHDEEQRRLAEASKQALVESTRFPQPIVTEIVAAGPFHPAEEYHQDYYRKNPVRYKLYRGGCGRDRRLQEIWGDEAGGHAAASEARSDAKPGEDQGASAEGARSEPQASER